jgi:predicted Na+-dependent transporter
MEIIIWLIILVILGISINKWKPEWIEKVKSLIKK